jgi:hypothetical protein
MDMAFAVSGKRRSNGQLTRASILDLAHGFGHGGVLRFGKTLRLIRWSVFTNYLRGLIKNQFMIDELGCGEFTPRISSNWELVFDWQNPQHQMTARMNTLPFSFKDTSWKTYRFHRWSIQETKLQRCLAQAPKPHIHAGVAKTYPPALTNP